MLHDEPPLPPPRGLCCPRCGCGRLPVQRNVRRPGGLVKRYRKCAACGRSVATWEGTPAALRQVVA